MNDQQLIEYAWRFADGADLSLRYLRVPEPPRPLSPERVDFGFLMAMLEIPGVTTTRIVEFEVVNHTWRLRGITRL